MKKILLGLLTVVAVLVTIMAIRAAGLESRQPPGGEAVAIEIDMAAVTARFSQALTFPTISPQKEEDRDVETFLAFHDFLAESFPATHEALAREAINELSLVYTWQGRNPALDPVLLMGHMDVVPVIPGTEEDWEHPPFGGVVADGSIWGRGSIDDKASVMSVLEAVEHLVAEGHQPERTIYLAFGHDEEVGGDLGARVIAETFQSRGIGPFAMVLDEGGMIAEDMVDGVDGRVAIIGIAEKGFVSLEVRVEGEGGHSSSPPEETNLGILARAVRRLEENQFPSRLDGATEAMLEWMAPEMPFGSRMLLGNLWLTRSLVSWGMSADRSAAPMVRTTTATTIIEGGAKENVLAIDGRAVINHRILPGDTRESVLARAIEVIDDDRVEVTALPRSADPSPISDAGSPAFEMVGSTVRQVLGSDSLVTPYLVIGGTDAKFFAGRSDSVFRFLPVVASGNVLEMVHGTNERLSLESLEIAVRYFVQLIRNTDQLP
jgi:carboxypeptidase PM20D1